MGFSLGSGNRIDFMSRLGAGRDGICGWGSGGERWDEWKECRERQLELGKSQVCVNFLESLKVILMRTPSIGGYAFASN